MQTDTGDRYTTTSFRTIGWAGAALFTLAPPIFVFEIYLLFYTTAIETNPTVGPLAALALVLSFASIPLMLVGRRQRHSASPTTVRRGRGQTEPAASPLPPAA